MAPLKLRTAATLRTRVQNWSSATLFHPGRFPEPHAPLNSTTLLQLVPPFWRQGLYVIYVTMALLARVTGHEYGEISHGYGENMRVGRTVAGTGLMNGP